MKEPGIYLTIGAGGAAPATPMRLLEVDIVKLGIFDEAGNGVELMVTEGHAYLRPTLEGIPHEHIAASVERLARMLAEGFDLIAIPGMRVKE